jgi:superfamily I DNA/RNA helicase
VNGTALSPQGPQEFRVFGPPGTGKTTNLKAQIDAACKKYDPYDIMVASFTNAAASELSSRGLPIPSDNLGTLHALAYRSLGRPPVTEGFIKQWNEHCPQYALGVSKNNVDAADELHAAAETPADELAIQYHTLRAMMSPRELWPMSVQAFAGKWEEWKTAEGFIDFTDMIEFALRDVVMAPGGPAVGFFDETQDFTPLELALVRKWGRSMDTIVLAGDDDQCVYHFKGATAAAFLHPEIEDDHKRVLRQSYRLPRQVQLYSQQWVRRLKEREPKEFQPRAEEGEVLRAGHVMWRYPDAMMRLVDKYLDNGKTIMFLAPCSYMLGPLLALLRKHGYPFHNPYTRSHGDWNPLNPANGTPMSWRVLALMRPEIAVWGDDARMWTWDDIHTWASVLKVKDVFLTNAKKIVEEHKGAPAVPEVIELLERVFTEEALGHAFDYDLEWYRAHLPSARQSSMDFVMSVVKKWGAAKLKEKPRITVGTIHSVKGGESDVVFLFPDLSRSGFSEWLGAGEGHEAIIRLFYVGMTRARETLIVCGRSSPMAVNL